MLAIAIDQKYTCVVEAKASRNQVDRLLEQLFYIPDGDSITGNLGSGADLARAILHSTFERAVKLG